MTLVYKDSFDKIRKPLEKYNIKIVKSSQKRKTKQPY